MKRLIIIAMLIGASWCLSAQNIFDRLDLDRPGLENVKALHSQGKDNDAAAALLQYYRNRKGVVTETVKDPTKVKISATQQKYADDALNHIFYVHDGYAPLNYGEDINWKYWPVRDNELRWQLHRQKWFIPMGLAYRVSGDEKYAVEWTKEYVDWIKKNTMDDQENARFAWRPLEVSDRLQNQPVEFQLFVDAKAFTPEFLVIFLDNYYRHADYLIHNYTEKGNHLLFEAQRMITAGSFFPEFKDAATWRQSGVDVLNKEINVQVYDDGAQFELDPHYHLAAINIFCNALYTADLGGFRNDFPQSYINTVEKMIMFYANICYPDYTNPCFSDAKITTKKEMLSNYRDWAKIFPDNRFIKYLATEGKEGSVPDYLSKGFLTSGFFVFRSSWGQDAIQMVVKAGPKAFWHCQPDNGTFEMWYNGTTLFPDSGSYVYEGEDEEVMQWRRWFRQTKVHNTVTLGEKDFDSTASRTLLWKPDGDVQVLVTENPGYSNYNHRRSVFFVDNRYFVIADEVTGSAKGVVSLHYQMPKGKVDNSREDMTFVTDFEGNSNMKLQVFGPEEMTMKKEEGWASTAYMKKYKRINASFNVRKTSNEPVRYITVIYPFQTSGSAPEIDASFKGKPGKSMKINVKIGNEKKTIGYTIE
jgi:heparan-sulfate lyase